MTIKISLIGMYNYDNTLFDGLTLPEGIVKEDFINSLLIEYGEMGVLYSDFEFMKFAIGVWSKKYIDSITRIKSAVEAEYNPIHNFDRHEEYEDDRRNGVAHSGTDTVEAETDTSAANEGKVSAYNESNYQPESMTEDSGHAETENRTTYGHSIAEDERSTHTGHLYGNIGVTKSQDMVKDEIELRMNHNLFAIIAAMFKDELLVAVY